MKCQEVDGKIHVSSIEFFLTDTCNLRCTGCATSSPYLSDRNLPDPDLFRSTLTVLASAMHSAQLKILGGEPLLNRDICTFMKIAKECRMFDRIRVSTNGLLLPRMTEEFWQLADVVEVSSYPHIKNQLTETDYERIRQKGRQAHTKVEINEISEFMMVAFDKRNLDIELVRKIYANCAEVHQWPCHTIYGNRLYRCSRVHTLDRYLNQLGVVHGDFTADDGLLIEEGEDLVERIRNYLECEEPLGACHYCYGTSGRRFPHHQLTVEEIRGKRSGGSLEGFSLANLDDPLFPVHRVLRS